MSLGVSFSEKRLLRLKLVDMDMVIRMYRMSVVNFSKDEREAIGDIRQEQASMGAEGPAKKHSVSLNSKLSQESSPYARRAALSDVKYHHGSNSSINKVSNSTAIFSREVLQERLKWFG